MTSSSIVLEHLFVLQVLFYERTMTFVMVATYLDLFTKILNIQVSCCDLRRSDFILLLEENANLNY